MNKISKINVLTFTSLLSLLAGYSNAEEPSVPALDQAETIVSNCDNKYAGEDQTTQLTVTVKNRLGSEHSAVYQRFWKTTEDNQEKLTLFTITPLDAKNTAFMQYTYSPSMNKDTEQWVYLPNLRKLKRVTIRDLSDSFLGSDLTHDDIRMRRVEDDQHKLLRVKESQGFKHFLIESTPKERESQYQRKIVHYALKLDSGVCLKKNVAYFDKKGASLKKQSIQWQQINGAWLWKRVEVTNSQSSSSSIFEVSNPQVNSNVDEKWFSVRMLKKGL